VHTDFSVLRSFSFLFTTDMAPLQTDKDAHESRLLGFQFFFFQTNMLVRGKREIVRRPRTSHSHARPSHCTATEHGFILTRLDTELDTSVK